MNITVHPPVGFEANEKDVASVRRRTRGARTTSVEHDAEDLLAALEEQDLQVAHTVELTPSAAPTRRRRGGTAETGKLIAELEPGEQAVVLLEQDGLFTWSFGHEESGGRRTRAATTSRVVKFDLDLQRKTTGSPRRRGPVRDFVIKKATAFVLRFVAGAAAKRTIAYFERNVEPGIVHITNPDATTWQVVDPQTVAVPSDRSARVLLLVHGTFSSTVGSYAGMGAGEQSLLQLALARYDVVLGYDHRTLSVDPLDNARGMLDALHKIPWREPPEIHAVAFSRGGLVLRSMTELLLPESDWRPRITRAVFVACTNAGTQMANPDNWKTFIDLYTSIAVAAARTLALLPQAAPVATVLAGIVRGVGAAVKYLAALATDEKKAVPGLAAMRPGGEFVTRLNETQDGQPADGDIQYCAITSNFDPNAPLVDGSASRLPPAVLSWLGDGVIDRVMGEPNDLVVNTASMLAIDPAAGAAFADHFDFGHNGSVFHCNYFFRPEVTDRIASWLDMIPLYAAAAAEEFVMDSPTFDEINRDRMSFEDLMADRRDYIPYTSGADPTASSEGSSGSRRSPRRSAANASARSAARTRGGRHPKPPVSEHAELNCRAEMDDVVELNKLVSLHATISREALEAIVSGRVSADARVVADTRKDLIVQVVPRSGFDIEPDTDRATIKIPAAGETAHLTFDLLPVATGQGEVWLQLRQGPVPLATLKLKPTIQTERTARPQRITVEAVAAKLNYIPTVVDVLRVSERQGTDLRLTFTAEFRTLGVQRVFESPPLEDIAGYVNARYKEIEDRYAVNKNEADAFERDLRGIGAQLFKKLLPFELQQLLWTHRNELKSVQVYSTEPYVPWEIVYIRDPSGNGGGSDGVFLGELGLIRWLYDGFPAAQLFARENRVKYVIPKYELEDDVLKGAVREAKWLKDTLKATALPPIAAKVYEALRDPDGFDVLHFACHGLAEADDIDDTRLKMQGRFDGDEYIEDWVLATTVENEAQLRAPNGDRPLIVVNACQTGRLGRSLSSIGGFAPAFIRGGAGAFVGANWSIGDDLAFTFVQSLYELLCSGHPLAEATKLARQAARDARDPTWLAYTVYGEPGARLVSR